MALTPVSSAPVDYGFGSGAALTGGHLGIRFGVCPQARREDRILNEIHATGGDTRRISDLFGLSISGGARYAAALEHPELREPGPHPRGGT